MDSGSEPRDDLAKSVFLGALEIAATSDRLPYLDRRCGDDAALRAEVETLLLHHAGLGDFLERPAPGAPTGREAISRPPAEGPGAAIGPYKLLQAIGEGGMGTVYMAEQERPVRRRVALKLIRPGMDSRPVLARFEAERQALALMDHPNIAKVLDAGTTDESRPYFVMELVKGVPITAYCDANRLTPRQRLELFVPVCRAIQHAHQKGVIHRDIKPSNVLIAPYDGRPVPKVIDFGVAKATGPRLTEATLFTEFGAVVGTPEYMSPEQAELNQLDVDTRSDIYALGVLLYELLTGTTPLRRERLRETPLLEVLRIIREEEPPRPSTRLSTTEELPAIAANRGLEPRKLSGLVRGELDWIVMKALETDRNRRYETSGSFAADVQRYLDDDPVQACPPSAWYRFRRIFRRNKTVLGVLGLVLFFIILVGVGAGWAVRDRTARRSKLNLEVGHALDEAAKAREQALTLTDNPALWRAALAEAASDLKRAQGLAAQDGAALEPATRERQRALQALLDADEADRRFAGRFEEVLFKGYEDRITATKVEIAFAAQEEAFRRYYGIVFGVTPVEDAATILKQRPPTIRDLLWGALDICLQHVPKGDAQARPWLMAVLEAADTGPWRKRAREAVRAGDWKAFEQVFEEAVAARQPPPLLDWLIAKSPEDSPIHLKLLRRFRQAYPGDFWANHSLAGYLHHSLSRPDEAIRYYTAALALRPHNPVACANLGIALRATGDLDGAIGAYREALDGHPDYAVAHELLGLVLEEKGDSDGAIAELREVTRLRTSVRDHGLLGNMLARKGLSDEAVASYRRAIELDPQGVIVRCNLGAVLLEKKGRLDEAAASYQEAMACCRRAIRLNPADGDSLNNLAWILVTCPHVPLRDPAVGVKLARKAVELVPNQGAYWNTMGVAHYRAGNWNEAVAALTRSVRLRGGGDSDDWFFLAMAHWRLGEREKARRWYDQGVQWMDKHRPKGRELGRFRAEAAELLKVDSEKG
jgi:serine/threonine protein kinase/Flp pilus assembly protein TadD